MCCEIFFSQHSRVFCSISYSFFEEQEKTYDTCITNYNIFVLSIMQEDADTLRVHSGSVCKSLVRLGYHHG